MTTLISNREHTAKLLTTILLIFIFLGIVIGTYIAVQGSVKYLSKAQEKKFPSCEALCRTSLDCTIGLTCFITNVLENSGICQDLPNCAMENTCQCGPTPTQ